MVIDIPTLIEILKSQDIPTGKILAVVAILEKDIQLSANEKLLQRRASGRERQRRYQEKKRAAQ